MRHLRFAATTSLLLAASACGLDTGGLLGDVGAGTDGGPTGSEDATIGTGGPGSDAGFDATLSDGGPPVDSGTGGKDGGAADTSTLGDTAVPEDAAGEDSASEDSSPPLTDAGADACLPAEICDNGVDDNCDGKIDCDDPMCGAWTCTAAAIPSGWTAVEYAENSKPACDPGWGGVKTEYEGPSGGPATCLCNCDVTSSGSCLEGNFGNDYGNGNCNSSHPLAADGGGCTPGPMFGNGNGLEIAVTPAPYTPGTCSPSQKVSAPNITFQDVGVSCHELDAGGAGCQSGGSCVPKPTGAFALCIQHGGDVTCPAGYSNEHTVGTDAGDTRGCTPCTCGAPTGTCTGSVSFYTDSSCTQGAVTVPANATCGNFPGPMTGIMGPVYVAYQYTAQAGSSELCGAPTPGLPEGGVELTGVRTICCP